MHTGFAHAGNSCTEVQVGVGFLANGNEPKPNFGALQVTQNTYGRKVITNNIN